MGQFELKSVETGELHEPDEPAEDQDIQKTEILLVHTKFEREEPKTIEIDEHVDLKPKIKNYRAPRVVDRKTRGSDSAFNFIPLEKPFHEKNMAILNGADGYQFKRRFIFVAFGLGIIAGLFALTLHFSEAPQDIPEPLANIWSKIEETEKRRSKTKRQFEKSQKKALQIHNTGPARFKKIKLSDQASATCGRYRSIRPTGISSPDYQVASCLIVAGLEKEAIGSLQKQYNNVLLAQKYPNQKNALAQNIFALIDIGYSQTGKVSKSLRYAEKQCTSWEFNSYCTAKVRALTHAGKLREASKGFTILSAKMKNNHTKPYHYLSGADLAYESGKYTLAVRRYYSARKATPHENMALLATIYRGLMYAAAKANDTTSLRNIHKEIKASTLPNKKALAWRAQFLADLTIPNKQTASISNMLRNAKNKSMVQNDFTLASLTIKKAIERKYLHILDSLTTGAIEKLRGKISLKNTRVLRLMAVRGYLAQGKNRKALNALSKFKSSYGTDYVVSHLQGLALMGEHTDKRILRKAADAFEEAYEKNSNSWQSLAAYSNLLAQTGDIEEFNRVLSLSKKTKSNQSLNLWSAYNYAVALALTGHLKNSLKSINQINRHNPLFAPGWHTALFIHQKTRNSRMIHASKKQMSKIRTLEKDGKTHQNVYSPLGPLVFLQP